MVYSSDLKCFLMLGFLSFGYGGAPTTLRHVTLIYRHGDRSPMRTFPTDPHQEDAWPQGFGQLTQTGMNQEYTLGQFFRRTYSGFLNDTYNRKEIYVQSTDVDRTLMSAYSVLAGLYAPRDTQVWNEKIPWQPIPVHTVPQESDTLFRWNNCPMVQKERQKIMASPEVLSYLQKYQDLADELRNFTRDENITNIIEAHYINDVLVCEESNNKPWAPWVNKSMAKILFTEVVPVNWYLRYKTKLLHRLTGGLFIRTAINTMIGKQENILDEQYKMTMYSAHDNNVVAILSALGLYNNVSVPYSIALMLELHQSDQPPDSYFVQVWLRNDTIAPYQLTLKGCTKNCPFEQFVNLTKDIVPEHWLYECQLEAFFYKFVPLSSTMMIVVGTCFGVFIIFVITLTVCCHRKCPRRKISRTYGKLRAQSIPEEVPMMNSTSGGLDLSDEEL